MTEDDDDSLIDGSDPDVIVDLGIAIAIFLLGYVAVVAASGLLAPTGVIISESMAPEYQTGDVVLFVDDDRAFDGQGDATGDIVVFRVADAPGKRIMHRAHFHVKEGENWYGRADEEYLNGADSCVELRYCPAPHDGYITKGLSNEDYDQAAGITPPVRSEWIDAKAVGSVSAFPYVTYTNVDDVRKTKMDVPVIGGVPTEAGSVAYSIVGMVGLAALIRVLRRGISKLPQR